MKVENILPVGKPVFKLRFKEKAEDIYFVGIINRQQFAAEEKILRRRRRALGLVSDIRFRRRDTTSNASGVLDGDLDEFIKSYLMEFGRNDSEN